MSSLPRTYTPINRPVVGLYQPPPRPLCVHCKQRRMNRPRGLCFSCSIRPEIRALYPSTSKYAKRGCGLGNQAPLPTSPTTALPGTARKVAVLEERARLGQSLWHPLDARDDGQETRRVEL